MSDQGPAPPPSEEPEDPQSHLRIIPPDPVPADDGEAPASPAPPPGASPAGPRVRVFSDEDPAMMPLPAMGPGSGGSRLPDDAEAPDVADADDDATATATMEQPIAGDAAPTDADAGMDEGATSVTDGEDMASPTAGTADAGTDSGDSEPASADGGGAETDVVAADTGPEELEAEPTEPDAVGTEPPAPDAAAIRPPGTDAAAAGDVDDGPAGSAATAAAGVTGVRLDRSDTGEIIKVSADQVPRGADGSDDGAAVVVGEPAGAVAAGGDDVSPAVELARRPSAVTKVVTGLAFGVVALVFILLGRPAFAALAGLLIVWGAVEFYGALNQFVAGDGQVAGDGAGTASALSQLTRRPAAVLGVLAVAAMVVTTYFYGIEALGALALAAFVAAVLWFVPDAAPSVPPRDATLSALGIAHVGVAGCFAMLTLRLEHGFALLLVVVILTIVCDVAAYGWGANLGHTPFFQSVSPNKSLEGFLGAVATTIVAGLVVTGLHGWLYPSVPVAGSWGQMFALSILVAVAATAGDLSESLFKRELGIKDVASILPGHGGMMDRLDGMLFALPVAYVFLLTMGLADVG